MERNPLIEYNDGLVITYSDLKGNEDAKYITVYLEKPNKSKTDFDSAQIIFPGAKFEQVVGFSNDYLEKMRSKITKMGNHALLWAIEDAATI